MGIPIYNLYITKFDKINGCLKGYPTSYKDENFDNKDVCLRSDVEKYIYDLKKREHEAAKHCRIFEQRCGIIKEAKCGVNMTEEQKNCPYCHGTKNDPLPKLFECNNEDAAASIELNENVISFDNSDGHFMYGEFKINYCPICGRNLNVQRSPIHE